MEKLKEFKHLLFMQSFGIQSSFFDSFGWTTYKLSIPVSAVSAPDCLDCNRAGALILTIADKIVSKIMHLIHGDQKINQAMLAFPTQRSLHGRIDSAMFRNLKGVTISFIKPDDVGKLFHRSQMHR